MDKEQKKILEVNNLFITSNQYQRNYKILSDINLTLREKEIAVIVGEPGSLKDILVQTVFGMHEFLDGEITLNNKKITYIKNIKKFKNKPEYFHSLLSYNPENYFKLSKPLNKQIVQAYKDFGFYQKEKDFLLNPLKNHLNELNKELSFLKNPYKKTQAELYSGVKTISEKERLSLYRSNPKNMQILIAKKKIKKATNDFDIFKKKNIQEQKLLKINYKYFKGNKKDLSLYLKKEFKEKQNQIKLFEKKEFQELNDFKREPSIINFKYLFKAVKSLNKKINKIYLSDKNIRGELKNRNFKLAFIKSEKKLPLVIEELKLELDFLHNFFKEKNNISSLIKDFNFINELLNPFSALNSKTFMELDSFISKEIKNQLKLLDEIIWDIKKYTLRLKKEIKCIANKNLVQLIRKDLVNLNYESLIYAKIKSKYLNFENLYKEHLYSHYFFNRKRLYKFLLINNKKFFNYYLELNIWKSNNKLNILKKKEDIFKKELFKKKKEFQIIKKTNTKILKKYAKEEKNINNSVNTLIEKIIKNAKEEILLNSHLKIERKNNKAKIEKTEEKINLILKQIQIIKNKYIKDNYELFLNERIDKNAKIINFDYKNLSPFPIKELSKLDKQKALIMLSLVYSSDFLAFQESISKLDIEIQSEMIQTYFNLKEAKDMSLLLIDYDLVLSNKIVDYIYILYKGKILEQGKRDEIMKNPIHPYTKVLVKHSKEKELSLEIILKTEEVNLEKWIYNPMNYYKDLKYFVISQDHYVLATKEEIVKWTYRKKIKVFEKNN